MKREYISPWKEHLDKFYEYRLLCGYKDEKSETYIFLFDRYYDSLGITELLFNKEIVEGYIELKPTEKVSNQLRRVNFTRQFAKYLFNNDILTNVYVVPPLSTMGKENYIPYIYSEDELHNIINYLENYKSPPMIHGFDLLPNMKNCVTAVFKILMSTGMRVGEVLNLRLSNVNFEQNYFTVLVAKNDNERIVPFSSTIKEVLIEYLNNTPFKIELDDRLFQTEKGNQLKLYSLHYYFYKSLKYCGIPHERGKGPRIHDFRHTFAVLSLTKLQHTEANVNLSLFYLSTYLGHKSVNETQKYIWMTPLLFSEVKQNMQEYSKFLINIFEGEKFDED